MNVGTETKLGPGESLLTVLSLVNNNPQYKPPAMDQQPEDWRDPSRRQRIAVKLDEAIRSYPGNTPSHMNNGPRLEASIFQKARSKDEYNSYVGRLLLSLTRHRSNIDPGGAMHPGPRVGPTGQAVIRPGTGMAPQPGMQPSFQPQPGGHVLQQQSFLTTNRQPHPSQQSYYLNAQPGAMGGVQPHPSPPQPHMQPGGPSSYGTGYPGQMQPRPQMMSGTGMPSRPPMVYSPARPAAPVAHHPGIVPGHAPNPAQPDMSNTGSPAQPATPGGMYSPAHSAGLSPQSVAMQPRPGGPHPPGPSPGMHGLGPAVAPSPSNQPPPSVQSQEEALEYDRKVKELTQYIPMVKKMIDSLMRNAREGDDPGKAEQISKLRLFLSALQDPERRLPMNMLDKWREALNRVPLQKPRDVRGPPDVGPSGVPPSSQPAPILELEPASPPPSHAKLFGAGKRPRQEFQEERIPAKFRRDESHLVCMAFLNRELDCLQGQFVVNVKRPPTEGNKTTDVQCKLEDDGMPEVPLLNVTLSSSYPNTCPEVDLKDYSSSAFLLSVQQHLKEWLHAQSSPFLLSNLLSAWETSVKFALRDTIASG